MLLQERENETYDTPPGEGVGSDTPITPWSLKRTQGSPLTGSKLRLWRVSGFSVSSEPLIDEPRALGRRVPIRLQQQARLRRDRVETALRVR